MIALERWIRGLKDICLNRATVYDNDFPGNSCLFRYDGRMSADCIGLIKGCINRPEILDGIQRAGTYSEPGTVIGDWTEDEILESCTEVSRYFGNVPVGAYLAIYSDIGHAGVYVGDFNDGSGVVNVVECTTDWGLNGVIASYMDGDGRRYNHKGGLEMHPWDAWGKLSGFIDYDARPEPKKDIVTVDDLVDAVIAGDFGNWPERVDNLYHFIQDKVDARYK